MPNETQRNGSMLSIIKALIKKWVIIVLVFVLCLGSSIAYSLVKIKPSYTAHTSIVLKLAISGDIIASNNNNNATLAKRNLPTVKQCLKSYKFSNVASAYYYETNKSDKSTGIIKERIQVDYGEASMIFTLGYTDDSPELAKSKLEAIIKTAPLILESEIEAERVDLVPVQNVYDVSVTDQKATVIAIGGVIGLVAGIAIALLVCLLDNKIRSKEEIEELTGINVIACVNSEINENGKSK